MNDCNLQDYDGAHRQCDKQIGQLTTENAELRAKVERTENDTNEEWLDAIAACYVRMFGDHWETRDDTGSNVGALFQIIEDTRIRAEQAGAKCEYMQEHLQFMADQPCERFKGDSASCAETGVCVTEFCLPCYARAVIAPTNCGKPLLARVKRLEAFVQEIADEGCTYGDNCPPFIKTNHYICQPCKAKRALERGEK